MPFRGKKDNRQNPNQSNLCLIVISAKEGKTLGKEEMGNQGWVDMGGLTEQGTFIERHVVLSSETWISGRGTIPQDCEAGGAWSVGGTAGGQCSNKGVGVGQIF